MICEYTNGVCMHCGYRPQSVPYFRNCPSLLNGRKVHEIELEQPKKSYGAGTELHSILRDWLGFSPSNNCQCNSMAERMNKNGVPWCLSKDGMSEILGVMRAEHGKRWSDGRTILPWSDAGARQLVLLACRRARANLGLSPGSTAPENKG
jgi:hypothetical protein